MRVRELAEGLAALVTLGEGDRIVVMSKDAEGNGYSPVADFSRDKYLPETTYSGSIGLEELTDAHRDQGYGEEDVIEGGEKCLTLWPTN